MIGREAKLDLERCETWTSMVACSCRLASEIARDEPGVDVVYWLPTELPGSMRRSPCTGHLACYVPRTYLVVEVKDRIS